MGDNKVNSQLIMAIQNHIELDRQLYIAAKKTLDLQIRTTDNFIRILNVLKDVTDIKKGGQEI